jgi:hypothetical protein
MAEFIQGTKPKEVFTKIADQIILQTFFTFCEFGTLTRIINDLRVSIDFFFNGDASLGSGLLMKY